MQLHSDDADDDEDDDDDDDDDHDDDDDDDDDKTCQSSWLVAPTRGVSPLLTRLRPFVFVFVFFLKPPGQLRLAENFVFTSGSLG